MTAYDRVHALGQLAGELDYLALAAARPRGIAERAGMGNDDNDVRSALPETSHASADNRCRIVESQTGDVRSPRCRGSEHGCKTDDSYFRAAERNQCIVGDPWHIASIRISHVRAQYRVPRIAHARAQRVGAPVEFMIAERGSDVAH